MPPQCRVTGAYVLWTPHSISMQIGCEFTALESEIEIRQIFEAEDFGDNLSPEARGRRAPAQEGREGLERVDAGGQGVKALGKDFGVASLRRRSLATPLAALGHISCGDDEMARILVIEDEEDSRAIVQQALESDGHEVIPAADGAEGLALQRKNPADLVITDIFMPEKEGIETIHELKQEFPRVKIIAMSGGGTGGRSSSVLESLSTTANALGIDAFLPKPFDCRTLRESVRHVLQQPTVEPWVLK